MSNLGCKRERDTKRKAGVRKCSRGDKEREGPNLPRLVLNINMTFCKMMHVHDSLEVVFSSQSSYFYVI